MIEGDYTNLIKFLHNSAVCSVFNNKANLFRFSHAKSNKFNAVSGHRASSQGNVKRLTRGVIDKDATRM